VAVIALIALVLWGADKLFPPDPDALLLMDANTQIDQHLRAQDFQGALDVVETTRATLPDDPELLSWVVALAEQTGDSKQAQTALARLEQVLAEQPADVWLSVGERRLAVGDLEGAETATRKAQELEPNNPQVYFLLANVAEYRGDYTAALDLFEQTYTLAEQSNPQLAAIARIRMGSLMQRGPQQGPPPEPTQTP
jgi:cytochrome c-type biogenesis protein CcmH/NrfG